MALSDWGIPMSTTPSDQRPAPILQAGPWSRLRDARERAGLAEFERGNAVIPVPAMYEYYLSLTSDNSEPV